MKVIIIKNFQKYKVNEIIEVADGYAKNFLIKNGYAQPLNKQTLANLDRIKENIAEDLALAIAEAEAQKQKIEAIELSFALKSHMSVVHGSITTKAITKELLKYDIKLPKNALSGESYNTFGTHIVKVKLHPQVIANLIIKIQLEK
ncbi:ribosomal protein L9 [Metamycoplasma arthritidis]|uniref:50S ribosomal protein L9 n=2 Tax=Metamycoplasma arthritidis TaxID=2111 RepID=B3PN55_META1|nr:50S ribosomal protein L9 [Metamycoplasma arthritidis]ACF07457.1 ribosomal protein L9 [Metamycoplasma arthritidis 158L3-1]VEU78978.1 ribosomal protein L9 [Metamycoplasma arthritidis]